MKLGMSKVLYSSIVAIIYLFFGILLLLKYLVWQEVPDKSLATFGVVIIIYGLFRGYRAYKVYQTSKEEQDELE